MSMKYLMRLRASHALTAPGLFVPASVWSVLKSAIMGSAR